ncbi:hypothetical protein ES703_38247 [subsurface metagenome]
MKRIISKILILTILTLIISYNISCEPKQDEDMLPIDEIKSSIEEKLLSIDKNMPSFDKTLGAHKGLQIEIYEINEKYRKYYDDFSQIFDRIDNILKDKEIDLFSKKYFIKGLAEKGLNIPEKMEKLSDRRLTKVEEQSTYISILKGLASKFSDRENRSVAEKLADRLREANNLEYDSYEFEYRSDAYLIEIFCKNLLEFANSNIDFIELNNRLIGLAVELEEINSKDEKMWIELRHLENEIEDIEFELYMSE